MVCILLEQHLEREILFLSCQYYIFELVLQNVILKVKLYFSTGPDILLFKKF